MNPGNHLKKENQTYFAGQWAEAGVYQCLDPCWPGEEIVILMQDGVLPDPTHGWVARFHRIGGREAEHLWAKVVRSGTKTGKRSKDGTVEPWKMVKGEEIMKKPKPKPR